MINVMYRVFKYVSNIKYVTLTWIMWSMFKNGTERNPYNFITIKSNLKRVKLWKFS